MKEGLAALIGLLVVAGLVAAAVNFQYQQTATLEVPFNLLIDDVPTLPNSTISWGSLYPSMQYSKNVTITNTGATAINVTITTPNLPVGWTETCALNNTVLGLNATGSSMLVLTTPTNATAGAYNWQLTIEASAVP